MESESSLLDKSVNTVGREETKINPMRLEHIRCQIINCQMALHPYLYICVQHGLLSEPGKSGHAKLISISGVQILASKIFHPDCSF